MKIFRKHKLAGSFGIFIVCLSWFILPSQHSIVPPLTDVLATGFEMFETGHLLVNITASLTRIICGVVIGVSCSLIFGLLCVSSMLRAVLSGPIELARPIPPIAWIPLMLVIFGVGEAASIAIVALAVFFPVTLSIVLALENIDQDLVFIASSLGADWKARFVHVYVPSILPIFITGIRLGVGIGWFSVVAAEMVGSYGGLGYGIQMSSLNLEMEKFFVYLILIGCLGFIMNMALLYIGNRLTHWQPQHDYGG